MPDYKYIVTADDYGVSPYIDDAIEDGIKQGFVTAVAAFSNLKHEGVFVPHKAARLKEEYKDKVSMGLHFTITSGQRVSDPDNPLSEKGSREFRNVRQQPHRDVTREHIEAELWAQIEAYERARVVIDGVEQPLEIEHFSDHTGIISHTEIGLEALLNVVSTYNKERNKRVPMRNPMFIGTLVADQKSCLDDSLSTALRVPFQIGNAFRGGERRDVIFKRGEINAIVQRVHEAGIPTTQLFNEILLEHPRLTTWFLNRPRMKPAECIFDQENYQKALEAYPQYEMNNPIRHDVMTVEVVAHLAIRDLSRHSTLDYRNFVYDIINYGGIDAEYVQKGRVNEFTGC